MNRLAAMARVADELRRAQQKHGPVASPHEGYAIIAEELDEFWQQVKKKPHKRDQRNMAEELVQVAAMAIRTLIDCVEDDA